MKKLKLKLDSKEMLSKEEMKKISGGYNSYMCCPVGNTNSIYCHPVPGDNCCQAQAACDYLAYSNSATNYFPNGGDVVCPEWPC